jgi:NitT/TauT family transport system permease protein
MAAGMALVSSIEPGGSPWLAQPLALASGALGLLGAGFAATPRAALVLGEEDGGLIALLLALLLGLPAPLILVDAYPAAGLALPGLWLYLIGLGLTAWCAMDRLAGIGRRSGPMALAAPLLFGFWLLYVWEVLVTGFGVPQILLPAPHQIGHQLASQAPVLWTDFRQTFLKAVLAGWVAGCGLGFLVAVAIDRIPFFQRGLLPLGNLVSAVPVVGIAPIMVMWFGFDWQSKAAVIVVMTFFPMLINTLAGFAEVDAMSRDLIPSSPC